MPTVTRPGYSTEAGTEKELPAQNWRLLFIRGIQKPEKEERGFSPPSRPLYLSQEELPELVSAERNLFCR